MPLTTDWVAPTARLVEDIRGSSVVYTDDTSWRINGHGAYLMTFDSDRATVYQICDHHRHQECNGPRFLDSGLG
jgi:hypothetical protein